MLKKGSKLNSILTGTCPKCQNESMYEDKNPLHLSKVLKMNETCSHCGLRYQIEPSFFLWIDVCKLCIKCSSRSCNIHSILRLFRNKYKKLFFRHIRFLNYFIPLGFTMVEKHLHQYVCELRSIELKEISYFLNFLRYLFQFISSDKGN